MSRNYSLPGVTDNSCIDRKSVADFFDKRAEKISTVGPLHAVIYQDKHHDLAERRDTAEKKKLLPLLRLDGSQRILDIGCGTGRWTNNLAKAGGWYHGMDACGGLIDFARKNHSAPNRVFTIASADRFSLQTLHETVPFDRILCAGVLIYLNDTEVKEALRCMADVLTLGGLILIREPMGIKQRLTISQHYSDELEQEYNAIYRTQEELESMIQTAIPRPIFRLLSSGQVFDDPGLNNRSDTCQRWLLLERVE